MTLTGILKDKRMGQHPNRDEIPVLAFGYNAEIPLVAKNDRIHGKLHGLKRESPVCVHGEHKKDDDGYDYLLVYDISGKKEKA